MNLGEVRGRQCKSIRLLLSRAASCAQPPPSRTDSVLFPPPTLRHGCQNPDGCARRAQQPHIPHRRREPAAAAKREAHRAARCLQPASQARRVDENYRMECAADKVLAEGRRDPQRYGYGATADGVCYSLLRWCSGAYAMCRAVFLRPTTLLYQTRLGRTRRLPSQMLPTLALPPSLLRHDGSGGSLLLQALNHPHHTIIYIELVHHSLLCTTSSLGLQLARTHQETQWPAWKVGW